MSDPVPPLTRPPAPAPPSAGEPPDGPPADSPSLTQMIFVDGSDGAAPSRGFLRALWRALRLNLLAGLLVAVPFTVTGVVVWFLWGLIEGYLQTPVQKFLKEHLADSAVAQVLAKPGLALLVALFVTCTLLYLIGFWARTLLGRYLLRAGERLVDRIPGVRTVYAATKQLFRAIATSGSGRRQLRSVVLIPWLGGGGSRILGFITGPGDRRIRNQQGERLVHVFVPTTPNPTSGYLVLVPERELVRIEMTVEEAAQLIISGGLVSQAEAPGRFGLVQVASGPPAAPAAPAQSPPAESRPEP